MAHGAVLDPLDGDFLFTAEGCFFKGQVQPGAHVFAPAGCLLGTGPAGGAAAEEFTENVAQVAEISESGESAAVARTAAGGVVGVHAGKAVLVIAGALLVVGQDLVGLAHLLELFLGVLVAGVPVRVVLHGLFPVGPFNFIGAGGLFDAQHLVVISFICQSCSPLEKSGWVPPEGLLRRFPAGHCRGVDMPRPLEFHTQEWRG